MLKLINYFNFLGNIISSDREMDIVSKINRYQIICGTRALKNKVWTDIKIKSYKIVAVFILWNEQSEVSVSTRMFDVRLAVWGMSHDNLLMHQSTSVKLGIRVNAFTPQYPIGLGIDLLKNRSHRQRFEGEILKKSQNSIWGIIIKRIFTEM